ncbi:MAG: ABC transporter ATP-binding protein [Candidatus Methylomirabilales bacterium]
MGLLRIEKLTKRFSPRDLPAVENLTLTVDKGEIVALLGPSGGGKTTALRLIAGFETPSEGGLIEIAGQVVADGRTWVPPERRGVGMVFQDQALFPHLTVTENVAFGLRHLDPHVRAQRIHGMLETVELVPLAHRYPHELSGGQRQRVALARALAPRPSVILLDEPFSNLDVDLRFQMAQELYRILRELGTTAIFVTHDHEEAFMIADRVGVLNQGRLEQINRPEVIYHTPATRFVAGFVGKADFLAGRVSEEGIETEIGCLPNTAGFPPGAQVEVMIRPDHIQLIPDPMGVAMVLSRQFRGPDNLVMAQLPSGATIHSHHPSTVTLHSGSRATVVARPIHIVVFLATKPWL